LKAIHFATALSGNYTVKSRDIKLGEESKFIIFGLLLTTLEWGTFYLFIAKCFAT